MKPLILVISMMLLVWPATAQQPEPGDPAGLSSGNPDRYEDSTSLRYALIKGSIKGSFRYYFMATDSEAGLSENHAHAAGGRISYESASFRGFQLGLSGYFIFNLGSSALAKPDAATNRTGRYETGLFDVTDPSRKSNLSNLEELYLKYSHKQSFLKLGRQHIKTPFINLQDGRMRPTATGGLYGEFNEVKDLRIGFAYLYEMSPRSTVKWYSVAESAGLYPQGVNPDGSRSDYAGNLHSKGLGLLDLKYHFGKNLSLQLHNLYAENIFNSLLIQMNHVYPLNDESKLVTGLQLVQQHALNHGGNPDQSKTYFPEGESSLSWGGKWGWENRQWAVSANYNRITPKGRYLMPREWGHDPFFTFMPRERNEGFGDVHAYVIRTSWKLRSNVLKISLDAGHFRLPDVKNTVLNKYGMPSFNQVNADLRFKPQFVPNLSLQFLYVYKAGRGNTYQNPDYVFNKVNMGIYNLVIGYSW